MKALRHFTDNLRLGFATIGHNGRMILLFQPLWAIANALYAPYLTQYMLAVGCTKAQVGIINAVGMVSGAVIGLFAGWVTDRLGRRLATFYGDILNWAVSCLLWALASNWWWFLAGAISNSFVRLVGVSWNCLLTEDTAPNNRLTIFWWMNVANTTAIFFTPLMTPFINRWGLADTMRVVLLVTVVLYMGIYVLRQRVTRDTPISRERQEVSRGTSPLDGIRAFGPLIGRLLRNPLLLTFLLIRSIYYVQTTVKGSFFSVAVVQGMGFADSIIGTINLLTGVVMLTMQFILLPRLTIQRPIVPLMISLSALLLAHLGLVLAPAHSWLSLLLIVVVSSGGAVLTGMLVDTLTANAMPDEDRAPLLALTSVIMVALSAPLQLLSGFLAELPGVGPRLPMALVTALFALCIGLLALYARRQKGSPLAV